MRIREPVWDLRSDYQACPGRDRRSRAAPLQVPQLRLRRVESLRSHSREDLYRAHSRLRPVRGAERDPAGDTALGIWFLTERITDWARR